MNRALIRWVGALGVSLFVLAAAIPAVRADGPSGQLGVTLKTTRVVGDWGNQKSVAWVFKASNDGDPANDYWLIYVQALYKGGCFLSLSHQTTVAEYLYWPHSPSNPTMLDWSPGTYWEWWPQSFDVSGGGGTISWSVQGLSYNWQGSEDGWQDSYYKYDRFSQNLHWQIFATSSNWGKVASAVVNRVTQNGYQWAYIYVQYNSDNCWFWPFGQYTDTANTGWIYLQP